MTADELRTVRALFAANATRREVGEALGVAENDAVLICRHNGIGDEYTAAMKAAKTARQRGTSQERSDLSEKAWLRMCAEGSAKLRDRVLALYRRERERKAA